MQAMLLIYSDPDGMKTVSEADLATMWQAYGAYTEALKAAGAFLAGAPLEAAATAHTVRLAAGAPQVLDGPYAETREQLGGYYLIEVADMTEALRWAARCPGAAHGIVEVRGVRRGPGD
jgi:hypothetical protein